MRDNIELKYSYQIHNSKGKRVKSTRPKKCHSWVKAGLQILYMNTGLTVQTMKQVDTTTAAYASYWGVAGTHYFNVNATSGSALAGVVVGTGTNAVSFNDYCLQTLIAHGTGSGQLQYGTVSFGTPTTTSTTTDMRITRVFTNGSAGSITVNEIGLISYYSTREFLIIRDIVSPGVAIGVGESMTLNYIITTTI